MSREEVILDNIVRVGLLGEGSQGTVWSARLRSDRLGAPYALKYRLIKKTDAAMKDSKTSSAFREIEFYKKVANKFPDQFSKLYDWEIVEATPELRDKLAIEMSGKKRKTMAQYTHALITLAARKEGVLRSVYTTLNKSQWLSMLSQICYCISLIHDKGFSHGDIWEANIAYMKVPWDKTISIFRSQIPCLGYQWSIIDYGSAELKADETEHEKKKKRASSYELDDLISLASGEDDAEEVCTVHGVDVGSKEFERKIMSSFDGPSVRAVMKKTGLPIQQVLALVNLDSYLWHVCKEERTLRVRPWINKDALEHMADANINYASLAVYFARLTRQSLRDSEKRKR